MTPVRTGAPRILLPRSGAEAQRLIDAAKELDVPIHRDPVLAYVLGELPEGSEIPPELFEAAAQTLAWIYGEALRLDRPADAGLHDKI